MLPTSPLAPSSNFAFHWTLCRCWTTPSPAMPPTTPTPRNPVKKPIPMPVTTTIHSGAVLVDEAELRNEHADRGRNRQCRKQQQKDWTRNVRREQRARRDPHPREVRRTPKGSSADRFLAWPATGPRPVWQRRPRGDRSFPCHASAWPALGIRAEPTPAYDPGNCCDEHDAKEEQHRPGNPSQQPRPWRGHRNVD